MYECMNVCMYVRVCVCVNDRTRQKQIDELMFALSRLYNLLMDSTVLNKNPCPECKRLFTQYTLAQFGGKCLTCYRKIETKDLIETARQEVRVTSPCHGCGRLYTKATLEKYGLCYVCYLRARKDSKTT